MNTALLQLLTEWRAEAATFERRGCLEAARIVASLTADLENRLEAMESEPLTLAESVAYSQYSASQLRRLMSDGDLENVGTARDVRFRRGDLPRKPAGKRLDPAKAVEAVTELRRAS